jgi:hypothetical protein
MPVMLDGMPVMRPYPHASTARIAPCTVRIMGRLNIPVNQPRGHARRSKPKLRCISSAHSRLVRGLGLVRNDDVASAHTAALTGVSGSGT